MFVGIISAIIVIFLDQTLKLWVKTNIPLYESQPLINGVIDLYHIKNTGAGWGMLSGKMNLLTIISLVMSVYFLYLIIRNKNYPFYVQLTYGLLLGGSVGNLIDRLMYKEVTDMFRILLFDFPIFNIADVSLTLGVVGVLLVTIFNDEIEVLG